MPPAPVLRLRIPYSSPNMTKLAKNLLFQDHAGVTPRQLAVMAEDFELASYLESQEEVEVEKLEQGKSVFVNRGDFETPV